MSNERTNGNDPNAGRRDYKLDLVTGRWYHKSHVSKLDAKRRERGELTNADLAGGPRRSGLPRMGNEPIPEVGRDESEIKRVAQQIAADEQQRQRKRIATTDADADPNETESEILSQGDAGQASFEVEETTAQPREKKQKKPSRTAQADGAYIADNLLDIMNLTAKTFFGDVGEMTAQERLDIEKPLQRILARMDSRVMDTAQQFADPVALMFAASAWAIRVRVMRQMQRERNKPPTPQAQTQPQPTPQAQPTPSEATNIYPVGVNPMTANLSGLENYLA